MSNVALFALGAGVTLLTMAALALLVVGAVLDGREQRRSLAAARGPAAAPPMETPGLVVPLPALAVASGWRIDSSSPHDNPKGEQAA